MPLCHSLSHACASAEPQYLPVTGQRACHITHPHVIPPPPDAPRPTRRRPAADRRRTAMAGTHGGVGGMTGTVRDGTGAMCLACGS